VVQMRVTPYFATPLCWEKIDSINNTTLENYCYYLKDNFLGLHSPGGWQSGMIDLESIELSAVVTSIKEMLKDIANLYNINSKYRLELDNGWVNINNPGLHKLQNNHQHLHPEYFFSFVYYVKGTMQSGFLNLITPNMMLGYVVPDRYKTGNTGVFDSSVTVIPPEPGMLIAFPAWIQHFADPNNGTEDRISIAFNANIVEA